MDDKEFDNILDEVVMLLETVSLIDYFKEKKILPHVARAIMSKLIESIDSELAVC